MAHVRTIVQIRSQHLFTKQMCTKTITSNLFRLHNRDRFVYENTCVRNIPERLIPRFIGSDPSVRGCRQEEIRIDW